MDTITELLLKTNSLKNATVLAGKKGLKNKVSGVTVLEMSDLNEEGSFLLNLKEGEIVITSCNDIKEDVEKQIYLIYALQQRQIAGVVLFYLGYVIKKLDTRVIELCNKLEIPLICPPNDSKISYATVMNDIISLLMRKSEYDAKKERTILKRIIELNQKQKSFVEGMKFLSESYDISLMLLENSMEEIFSCGDDVMQMRELLVVEDFVNNRKNNTFFIDDSQKCAWKKIWHKNTYLWLGMFSKIKQSQHIEFIFQSFEVIVDIWDKDILQRSQHELILSILNGDEAHAIVIAEKQKIDLEKVRGIICVEKQGILENDKNIRLWINSVVKQEGFQIVYTELQQMFVYVLFGCDENRIFSEKETIENMYSVPCQTIIAAIYHKKDLFLFMPKVIEVFPKLKGMKVSKFYERSDVQSFLQMEYLLQTPMKQLYQSIQNRLEIYDKKNKSCLKKMVVDYCIEYKMNLKVMAKEQFIHYNTVQYRIKKIEELLQINLKNPADMTMLYMVSLFMKMEEKIR
ncbi:MAG: PucR family transcriptional regulator [Clostridiales bacterium]|nr:PucR family transcriptional regulator [Clostridiales bacterium]